MPTKPLWGKYRGVVLDIDDPKGKGRIIAEVAVAPRLNWAMPCVPYAALKSGKDFVPPVGTRVWVEFEAGDPDYPVWVGCMPND